MRHPPLSARALRRPGEMVAKPDAGAVPTPRPGDPRGPSLRTRCGQRDTSPEPDCAGRIAVSRLNALVSQMQPTGTLPRGEFEQRQVKGFLFDAVSRSQSDPDEVWLIV